MIGGDGDSLDEDYFGRGQVSVFGEFLGKKMVTDSTILGHWGHE